MKSYIGIVLLALLSCIIIPADVLSQDKDPSLILHLSFDAINGNEVVDHSQYQNHGMLVGNPQLVDGKFGKALKFNGTNDWVEVPRDSSLTVNRGVTVMAWIQTPRHQGPRGQISQGILAKGDGPRSYSLYTEAWRECLHFSAGGSGTASPAKVLLNEWQHVAVHVDNGTHRYWLNGQNVGIFHGKNPLPGAVDTANVVVGKTHESSREFLGLIDEVRIWNRALSEADIVEQMQTGYLAQPLLVEVSTEDVNGDGTVNIQDLVIVAARFGRRGQDSADVNGDGVVNISDLVLVAWAFGQNAAPPSMYTAALGSLTTNDIRQWLSEAVQMRRDDIRYEQGILTLKQLLILKQQQISVSLTPKESALLPNYPNPFNPETWIPYQLAEPAEVRLTISSARGELVRTLMLGYQDEGFYRKKDSAAYWDGRNTYGESVASGVYFYTLTAGDFTATKKMLIQK